MKKTILFAPATYNLAETTRCIQIAKAIKKSARCVFLSYGGEFEFLIREEGFQLHRLKPSITTKKTIHLYKIHHGKKLGELFSRNEIDKQVHAEIELIDQVKPVCIVTGFSPSTSISARVRNIPLVWITQTTWEIKTALNNMTIEYFDKLDFPVLQVLPNIIKNYLSRILYEIYSRLIIRPYNQVASKYKIINFKHFEELWKGDYQLQAESLWFNRQKTKSNEFFIGPLLAEIERDVPKQVKNIDRRKEIIYLAMGSSARKELLLGIIESFRNTDYLVITPSKSYFKDQEYNFPENVIVTDWFPAQIINDIADLSLIHGGIGTIMNAIKAGKPIIGIGMMAEQEANLLAAERLGICMRISRNRLRMDELHSLIRLALADKNMLDRARHYSKLIKKEDVNKSISSFFSQVFAVN
ncbi:hypothetical protein H3C67_01710 [Candidatus Dojkabacteria bacterium]|uniref:Glycosyl transferase family 28 C-terminal domain-containing protein n=1 Tax=Candidatus Dojkabacteria bacterium TaxID=2099670 RepID=A0A952AJU4_9BACT|nr:hypothetical protein [Candidatus Dojkabacteria bacterium]